MISLDRSGHFADVAVYRLWVLFLIFPLSYNDSGQIVRMCVPLNFEWHHIFCCRCQQTYTNMSGKKLLQKFTYSFVIVWNYPGTCSQSAIDLSICDPSLYLDVSWKVHSDLRGSDDFPIVIRSDRVVPSVTSSTWKLSKADSDTFSDKAASDLKADCIINAADPVGNFTDVLCSIANSTIPKSKSNLVKHNTIWLNGECKEVIKNYCSENIRRVFKSLSLLTVEWNCC